jgi:hypothetical protein
MNATADFDGISGNEACKGGCRLCHTDLCNDKVEGEETTTAKNEETTTTKNGHNNKTEDENNGGSRGTAPIALLLIGTMISMVVGTLSKYVG